jgi:hypothetical protein
VTLIIVAVICVLSQVYVIGMKTHRWGKRRRVDAAMPQRSHNNMPEIVFKKSKELRGRLAGPLEIYVIFEFSDQDSSERN